jgi:hypothetical protein
MMLPFQAESLEIGAQDIVFTVLIPHLSRTEAGLQDQVAPHGFTMTRRSDGQ